VPLVGWISLQTGASGAFFPLRSQGAHRRAVRV
jgi:hypothetical protein